MRQAGSNYEVDQHLRTVLDAIEAGEIGLTEAGQRLSISLEELAQLLAEYDITPPYSVEDYAHDTHGTTDDHETVLRQITDGEIMVATGATRLHISIADMLALLSQRGIDPPYSVEDLHVDLGLALREGTNPSR